MLSKHLAEPCASLNIVHRHVGPNAVISGKLILDTSDDVMILGATVKHVHVYMGDRL